MSKLFIFFAGLTLILFLASCHMFTPSTKPLTPPVSTQENSPNTVQPQQSENADSMVDPSQRDREIVLTPERFISYEVFRVHPSLRSDGGASYFVLVPPVRLDQDDYVSMIKNLVKEMIVLDKYTENSSILIFDDPSALNEVFQNPDTADLNVPAHYLAKYIGSPEEGTYRSNLIIFPFAPDSNPVIQSLQDVIDFDPFLW